MMLTFFLWQGISTIYNIIQAGLQPLRLESYAPAAS